MLRLAVCVAGIYICFLTWGYFQEKVSTTISLSDGSRFKSFIFLNLIQSISAVLISILNLKMVVQKGIIFPKGMLLKKYLQVALCNTIASPFSYAALKHIDYPTMILTKSCKLIPVMAMNILLYRKKFPMYKYVCVGLITLGVSGFMLFAPADQHKVKKEGGGGVANSSLFGMMLVIINLSIDGITNSTQDDIFQSFKISGQEMMLWMNFFQSLIMTTWLLNPFNPELGQALKFCLTNPTIIKDIGLFCLVGGVGQCFIFYTLEQFGSLSLVTVTVTRKLFTILLSVVAFGHFLSWIQWLMVLVVFSGIGLEAYVKRNEKLEKLKHHLPSHSPRPVDKKIGFGNIEMMKKDKILELNQGLLSHGLNHGYIGLGGGGGGGNGNNNNTTRLAPPLLNHTSGGFQDSTAGLSNNGPFTLRAGYMNSGSIGGIGEGVVGMGGVGVSGFAARRTSSVPPVR